MGRLIAPFGAAGPTGAAYYLCRPAELDQTAAARRVARWLETAAEDWRSGVSSPPGQIS
jgi:LysR family transcriptional regulator, glycine cleavage system transcriptional activator